MLDMIAVSKNIFKRVSDCKTVVDGVRSDHSAVCLKLKTCLIEFKDRSGTVSKGEVDKESIQCDQKINAEFNECFNKKWDQETSYEDFCKALMEAARETASRPIEVNKPWFDFNKESLYP